MEDMFRSDTVTGYSSECFEQKGKKTVNVGESSRVVGLSDGEQVKLLVVAARGFVLFYSADVSISRTE